MRQGEERVLVGVAAFVPSLKRSVYVFQAGIGRHEKLFDWFRAEFGEDLVWEWAGEIKLVRTEAGEGPGLLVDVSDTSGYVEDNKIPVKLRLSASRENQTQLMVGLTLIANLDHPFGIHPNCSVTPWTREKEHLSDDANFAGKAIRHDLLEALATLEGVVDLLLDEAVARPQSISVADVPYAQEILGLSRELGTIRRIDRSFDLLKSSSLEYAVSAHFRARLAASSVPRWVKELHSDRTFTLSELQKLKADFTEFKKLVPEIGEAVYAVREPFLAGTLPAPK